MKIENIIPTNTQLNVEKYEIENIKDLIYTIRGKQVMLDSDVANLYNTETRVINQAVKRNIGRFPEEFCFKLTDDEFLSLRSQIVILNLKTNNKKSTRKYKPYVFTEQGIAMLSGLLKSEIAIKVSINIIEAFVEMRRFIVNNGKVFERLENIEYKLLSQDKKLSNHEKNFEEVFNELQKNKQFTFNQQIFFNGQIYDSYSLIIDIIKTAKTKILIIDNYIDDSILKMLIKKNKNVEVEILTSKNCKLTKLDITKFNKQYGSLKIAITDRFHDRFIIIDNKELYHVRCIIKGFRKEMFCSF